MAFKLKKSEEKRRQEIIGDLQVRQLALSDAQEQDPLDLEDLQHKLAELLVTIAEAEEFRLEVAERLCEEYDEKSEKWLESDAASEAEDFISEWENAQFDEPGLEDLENLEIEDYAEILENLPDSVE